MHFRETVAALIAVGLGGTLPVWAGPRVVKYYHVDAVGNVRAVTDSTGAVIERHDYLPFGEECTTGSCAGDTAVGAGQTRKFTGKERDKETELDYFGARYFSSRLGRFTAVDPKLNLKNARVNPQRWNRYAYVSNNPFRFVDPDGREQTVIVGGKTYMGGVDGLSGGNERAKNEAFVLLVAATAAAGAVVITPALVTEAAIVGGNCAASPGCRNGVTGLAEGFSGAAPGSMGTVPTLAATGNTAMLREAMGYLKAARGTAAEKARLFEALAAQIAERGEGWAATRVAGADGSHIFIGGAGETLVIDSSGSVFRGSANAIKPTGGTSFVPDYGAMKKVN